MDPAPGRDRLARLADAAAVPQDRFARRKVAQRDLVAGRDALGRDETPAVRRAQRRAGRDVLHGDGDRVSRVQLDDPISGTLRATYPFSVGHKR